MAKQKLKNIRKSPGPARLGLADPDTADRRGAIKSVRKRKSRSERDGLQTAALHRAKSAGKGKVKTSKLVAPDPGGAEPPLATTPLATKAVRGLIGKVVRRPARLHPLDRLEIAIDEVRLGARASPRTRKLQTSGLPKMAQKVIEEAGEVAIEAIQGNRPALVAESADLLYNLLVLFSGSGVPLSQLWAEMDRRELALGMAEKLPKIVDLDG